MPNISIFIWQKWSWLKYALEAQQQQHDLTIHGHAWVWHLVFSITSNKQNLHLNQSCTRWGLIYWMASSHVPLDMSVSKLFTSQHKLFQKVCVGSLFGTANELFAWFCSANMSQKFIFQVHLKYIWIKLNKKVFIIIIIYFYIFTFTQQTEAQKGKEIQILLKWRDTHNNKLQKRFDRWTCRWREKKSSLTMFLPLFVTLFTFFLFLLKGHI